MLLHILSPTTLNSLISLLLLNIHTGSRSIAVCNVYNYLSMYTLFSLFRIGATLPLLLLSFCSLLTDLFTTLHQFSAIIFLLISKFTSFFHHLLLCLLLSFRVTLNLASSNILFLLKSFHHFIPVLWNSLPSNLHIHSQCLTETSPFSLLFLHSLFSS
jgi:hypothetical protein